MMMDGKSMVHGHEDIAEDGIGTLEQKFDSMGTLSIVVESIKVGDASINDFAQFKLNVAPEFPVLPVVMSAGLVGSAIASRFFFFHKKN